VDAQAPAGPAAPTGRRIRLGSGTAWALSVQLVTAVSTLVVGAIVARTLGPEGKGVLSLLQQSVGILVILGDLGLGVAAIYYISKGEVRAGTVLGNALVLLAGVSVLALGGLVVLLRSPLAVIDVSWTYTAVAFALFALSLLLSWVGAIVTGVEGTRGAARAAIVSSSVTLVAVVAFWLAGWASPLAVLAAAATGAALGIASGLLPVLPALHPVRASREAFRLMTRYSLKLHAATAADLIHFRQDLLILGWLGDTQSVGVYSVALSVAEIASRLPSAIGAAIQAQASRVSERSALDFSARALRLTVLVALGTVVVLVVLVPVAVPAVFGAAFVPAVGAFYLLIPRIFANALVWPVSSYQSARGIVYWRVSMGATALNAALNVALVPVLGFHGSAIAASASNVVLLVLLLQRLCRDTGKGPRFFLVPTREDLALARDAARGYARVLRKRHQVE
jgi:O-antigen/teichoic acid export membrane protein